MNFSTSYPHWNAILIAINSSLNEVDFRVFKIVCWMGNGKSTFPHFHRIASIFFSVHKRALNEMKFNQVCSQHKFPHRIPRNWHRMTHIKGIGITWIFSPGRSPAAGECETRLLLSHTKSSNSQSSLPVYLFYHMWIHKWTHPSESELSLPFVVRRLRRQLCMQIQSNNPNTPQSKCGKKTESSTSFSCWIFLWRETFSYTRSTRLSYHC